MDALAFLGKAKKSAEPLYVLYGEEDFLKRQVLQAIRNLVLEEEEDEQAFSTYPGDKADFAEVVDELSTVPFFTSRRLVVVENADPFVTRHRAALEKRIGNLPATGTLVLEVKSWPANTRLAKMVDPARSISCKGPPPYKLPQWCADWSLARYEKKLPPAAAALLVDLVGAEMGLLDQEIAKLAVFVGAKETIATEDVDRLVGRNRAESTWKIFDALGAGQAEQALTLLDRLLEQGEDPMRMLGAFAFQLRKLAAAGRLALQGKSMTAALEQAGVAPFGLKSAETQLKHLGRRRVVRLYDDLLQLNMDVRGDSPLPARLLLERFLIRLARRQSG